MRKEWFDTYDFPELKQDDLSPVDDELQEKDYPLYIWMERQSNDYSSGPEKVVTEFVNYTRKFHRVLKFLCDECSRPKVMQFTSSLYYNNRYKWNSHTGEPFVDLLPKIIQKNYTDVDYELNIDAPRNVNIPRIAEMGLAVRIGIVPDMSMESAGELICKLSDIMLSRKWYAYCWLARPDGFFLNIDSQKVFELLWRNPEKITPSLRNEALYQHLHDDFHMIPDLWGNRQEVMQNYLDKRAAKLYAISEHKWLTELPKCC